MKTRGIGRRGINKGTFVGLGAWVRRVQTRPCLFTCFSNIIWPFRMCSIIDKSCHDYMINKYVLNNQEKNIHNQSINQFFRFDKNSVWHGGTRRGTHWAWALGEILGIGCRTDLYQNYEFQKKLIGTVKHEITGKILEPLVCSKSESRTIAVHAKSNIPQWHDHN